MAYAAFIAAVRDRGDYEPGEAEEVTEAVVTALGRRLPPEVAEHLADQLPQPLADVLADAPARTEDWGMADFCDHLSETLGTGSSEARSHARSVLSTVAEHISGGELNKLLSDLPSGYAALFGHPELTG